MITVCHVLLPISSAGIVRASSVFPILSTILLLLGGLCVGAGRIYNSKNNIILSAGILFVAAGMFSLNWVLKKCCLFGTENAKVQLGGEATSPARCPAWPSQGQGPKNTTGQSVLWVQLGGEEEGHHLTSTALLPLPEFPSQSLNSFRAFSLQWALCDPAALHCWSADIKIRKSRLCCSLLMKASPRKMIQIELSGWPQGFKDGCFPWKISWADLSLYPFPGMRAWPTSC